MAGDWLKIQVSLPDKPEVWQMAGILAINADEVVGKLIRVWRWFDAHTEDGHATRVTFPLLDHVAGATGFAEAMQMVGWLEESGTDIRLPHFDRHNGKTAKNRALATERKAAERSRNERDTSVTREEKRREEKKEQKTGASTNVESTPKKPSRGTRLPEDWEPSAEQIAWARKERPDIDPLLEARTFRNHWVSKPGKDAVKLNWNATWQNWISRAYGSPKKGTGSTTYARLPGEL